MKPEQAIAPAEEGEDRLAAVGKTIAARLQELREIQSVCTSVLSRDEAIAEFAHLLAELEKEGPDKIVQPRDGGYQPNNKGITAAAEEWPLPGKGKDARRKHVERSVKIANLPPKVKAAAVEAELQNRRSALLEVAKEKGLEAQLLKIKQIVARPPRKRNQNGQTTSGLPPQSAAPNSDDAYSALSNLWNVSPADAKARFKRFINGGDLPQAA
jgi:hypothetical protein